MKQIGLEIIINDVVICRAGDASQPVGLTCMIQLTKLEPDSPGVVELIVRGSTGKGTLEILEWVRQEVKKGDIVEIKQISDNFDPPVSIGSYTVSNPTIGLIEALKRK
ncbi:MAG: hypothetical protein NWR72_14585 [Bacteroidia bacterium]|nr:hypothetical protein [Bacteroidia bacterium]